MADVAAIRQYIRTSVETDKKISAGEATRLGQMGVKGQLIERLRRNMKDSPGGLSEGELMAIINTTNIPGAAPKPTAPTRTRAPAPAPNAATPPAATTPAGQPATNAVQGIVRLTRSRTSSPNGGAGAMTPTSAGGGASARGSSNGNVALKGRGATSNGPANEGRGTYRVTVDNVYLRTHRQGLVRGNLNRGDEFVVLKEVNGWAWGYSPRIGQHGWVPFGSGTAGEAGSGQANVQRQSGRVPKGAAYERAPQNFGTGALYVTGKDRKESANPALGYFRWADRPTSATRLYSNLSGDQPRDDSGVDLAAAQQVRVRYESQPGWFLANVIDGQGASHWGFIRASELRFDPNNPHNQAYEQWRRERGA